MDPTSKQNMSVLDRHFDQKLDRLMNDFKTMQTHNDVSSLAHVLYACSMS
jgi:hypothetical protein